MFTSFEGKGEKDITVEYECWKVNFDSLIHEVKIWDGWHSFPIYQIEPEVYYFQSIASHWIVLKDKAYCISHPFSDYPKEVFEWKEKIEIMLGKELN